MLDEILFVHFRLKCLDFAQATEEIVRWFEMIFSTNPRVLSNETGTKFVPDDF